MSFEEDFHKWLSRSLGEPIPITVGAFSLNLFEWPETEEVKFGVELIGAAWFDEEDQDWVCDEVWEPPVRSIDIPKSFSGTQWDVCLLRIKALALEFLASGVGSEKLKSSFAVGIGFVDGDLEILWQQP